MAIPAASGKSKTHHVMLNDGSTYIGLMLCDSRGDDDGGRIQRSPLRRMPLKLQQGNAEWSDFELPYQNVAQDDWSGGRGLKEDTDPTRYWHGFMVNTMHQGKAFLGPQPNLTDGYRPQNYDLYGSTTYQGLYGNTEYLARQFTPSEDYDGRRAEFYAKQVGNPNGNLTVELWSDSGGEPDAIIAGVTGNATTSDIFTWLGRLMEVSFGSAGSLTNGTDYWIVIYGDSSDDADNHWAIGVNETVGTDEVRQSADGASFSGASVSPYFRVTDWQDPRISHFFEFRGALYMVTREDDGGAPELYINGDRGEAESGAASQSSTTLVDDSKSWTADEWIGSICVLVMGTGAGQWREITDNTDNDLTINPAWETTPVDANTEYVIVASDKWTEIGTTGLTGPITDVLVVRDTVYFAQGESVNIRRFNYDSDTNSFADDGTNKASFLELVGDYVWKANNGDIKTTVAKADVKSWGTNLSFGDAVDIGNGIDRITNLDKYFDPEYLMVFKRNGVWRIVGDEPQKMPLGEMAAVASENTGRAAEQMGAYYFFSLIRGLQRYYNNQLDDIGPDRDDGLQPGYQGPIYDLLSYPGRLYAAVSGEDWGTSSYSSIQAYNGLGWHPFFRSPLQGTKIRKLHMQVIPGSTLDRLWVSDGTDVLWLPMPSETTNPLEDSNYKYFHCGMLETSWQYMNLRDIEKTYKSMKMFVDDTLADNQYIEDSWSLNGGSSESVMYATYDSIVEEHDLDASQVKGYNIRFKHIFWTTDETKTPVLRATVMEAVAHLPTRHRYSVQFRARDRDINLLGQMDTLSAQEKLEQLQTWANAGTRLTMQHEHDGGPYDNVQVFVSAPSDRPYYVEGAEDLAGYICTMEMFEA